MTAFLKGENLFMKVAEVKKVLIHKGVIELFHVNSVITSLTFINNGGLLSRETVEEYNLPQTDQKSDDIDKKFNIYNDIFFDSVDIHERAKDVNNYGVITFVYSVDVLDEVADYDICITQENPANWDEDIPYEERYFPDVDSLYYGFHKGDFGNHITVRNISKPISFQYLKKIIIDNPGEDGQKYFSPAYEAIKDSIENNNINVPIEIRECPPKCKCHQKYETNIGFTYHRFKIR